MAPVKWRISIILQYDDHFPRNVLHQILCYFLLNDVPSNTVTAYCCACQVLNQKHDSYQVTSIAVYFPQQWDSGSIWEDLILQQYGTLGKSRVFTVGFLSICSWILEESFRMCTLQSPQKVQTMHRTTLSFRSFISILSDRFRWNLVREDYNKSCWVNLIPAQNTQYKPYFTRGWYEKFPCPLVRSFQASPILQVTIRCSSGLGAYTSQGPVRCSHLASWAALISPSGRRKANSSVSTAIAGISELPHSDIAERLSKRSTPPHRRDFPLDLSQTTASLKGAIFRDILVAHFNLPSAGTLVS
jgi:hypothetical protein